MTPHEYGMAWYGKDTKWGDIWPVNLCHGMKCTISGPSKLFPVNVSLNQMGYLWCDNVCRPMQGTISGPLKLFPVKVS